MSFNPMWAMVAFLGGSGLALLIFGWYELRRSRGTLHWPTTEGTISKSHIEESEVAYSNNGVQSFRRIRIPIIGYTFAAGGMTITSERLRIGSPLLSHNESLPEPTIARYPLGKKITVYYDPSKPDNCVIEPGTSVTTYIGMLVGLSLFLSGVWLVHVFIVPIPFLQEIF